MSVKNWSFGCRPPVEGRDLVERQIELAHQYRNKLVELERLRRTEYLAFCQQYEPTVIPLEEEVAQRQEIVEDAVRAINQYRSANRSRTAPSPLLGVLAGARLNLRESRGLLREAKQSARDNPEAQEARLALAAAHFQRQRDARAEYSDMGLYWGNYLSVEDAAKDFGRGTPPEFRRWRDGVPMGFACDRMVYGQEGKVSVQIQKGMSWDEALACKDQRFRLEMVERIAHPSCPVQEGSKRSQRVLSVIAWLRVGSTPKGKPVWAKFPVRIHRRPDSEVKIKWVHALRTFAGAQSHWKLLVSVQESDANIVATVPVNRVAVNPGWRVVEGGLRVATWVDDDGNSGHLVLPQEMVDRFHHADSLRAIADTAFDEMRQRLVAYLHDLPVSDVSNWLREFQPHLHLWKSRPRLRAVALEWEHRRFAGDEMMFLALEAWRKQDEHLADWEGGARFTLQKRRLDLYRNMAAELRKTHGGVVLGLTGQWRSLAKLPEVESNDPVIAAQRYNQRIASPGMLEQTLATCGMRCNRVDAAFATMDCHVCGSRETFDAAVEVVHTCSRCRTVWDQDKNHCCNLLKRASSGAVDETPGTARDPESEVA